MNKFGLFGFTLLVLSSSLLVSSEKGNTAERGSQYTTPRKSNNIF